MKEFWIGVLVGLVLAVIGDLFAIPHRTTHTDLIRDCSLTGTHIIDEKTIVVCQVLNFQDTPANTLSDKKPEISL